MKKTYTISAAVTLLLAASAAGAAEPRFSTSFESGQPAPAALTG